MVQGWLGVQIHTVHAVVGGAVALPEDYLLGAKRVDADTCDGCGLKREFILK